MAEQEASRETELQLKKRARRRLVGASALVLLAVIVLPMVMDHQPRPTAQDIQVRIPSPETPNLAARVLQGKEVAPPLPTVVPKAEVQAEPTPEAKAEIKPTTKAESPKAEPPKVEPAKVEPAKAEPAKVAAPAAPAKAESKVVAPPPTTTATTKVVDTKAAPSAAAAKAPTEEGSGPWEIQLGAYKDAGNAKVLLGKLKELKLPVYTEKFDSPQGSRIRVRAGPFASREAAEKAHGRLKIIGVNGPVAQKNSP